MTRKIKQPNLEAKLEAALSQEPADVVKSDAQAGHWRLTLNPGDVPDYKVSNFRRMKGGPIALARHFNCEYAAVTDQQVREYLVYRARAKAVEPAKTFKAADADKLYRDYLKRFAADTPNDHASLRQLASIELALQKLSEARIDALMKGEIKQVKDLIDAEKSMSAEHRQLQQLLGIDKSTRDKQEQEKGGADYMRDLLQQSKALYTALAVPIRCPACKKLDVELSIGHVMCHFAGWRFELPCPKCGALIVLTDKMAGRL